jgi:flagellin
MSVINTNIKSLISQNALIKNNRALSSAMEQLSTGKRINSAKDDAAGLAVSNRMSAQIRGLDQAVRNANDGISLIQTVEGSLNEVTSMLQRMRELSIQSANDTNTVEDRGFLDLEFQQLKDEINRIAKNTQWNGMDILNKSPNAGNGDGKFEFQVGANADQLISIQLNDFRTEAAVPNRPGTPTTQNPSTGTPISSNITAAKAATALIPVVPPTLAKPQESVLTLSGEYAANDTIKLDMVFGDTTKSITYTVQAADVGGTNAENLAKIRSAIVSQAGIDTTLGVTLTTGAAAGTIKFTGPEGVSFTPTVTSTIAAGGKATAQAEVAGTDGTRENTSVVLSGDYKVGDVISFNNGTNKLDYVVKSGEDGTAKLSTLANNIATAATGYLANTTVDATAATLKFTATSFGAGTLNLTSSVQNASNKFTTTAAVVGSPGSPEVPASPAVAQVDRLTLDGSFDAGDKVKVTIGANANAKAYEYTVTDADAQSGNINEAIAKGLALTLIEASPAPGVTVSRSGSNISLTGNANGTPVPVSASITPRPVAGKPAGSLNMIAQTQILTRADANTAIESVDAAMSVINQSRAVMGAVMNRLTYAGDNLTNVAQNTSESRSRILDADFAKASSELARTQIISQAATSVLAQANSSQQSVLQLLQG